MLNPTCVLCGNECENELGNNANPVKDRVCCDLCHLDNAEICSREASYDDHSSRGQSQYYHELGQFSEGPSYLGHREQ